MTMLVVDGRAYSPEVLNESIEHPRNGKITLIVRNFDSVETREIQYAGGIRHPHLERIPGTHDYLSEILTAEKEQAASTGQAPGTAGSQRNRSWPKRYGTFTALNLNGPATKKR